MEESIGQPLKKVGSDLLGLGFSMPLAPRLEVRVFYVRVNCCSLDDAPETLTIKYGPRPIASTFEINGIRVPATDEPILILRRDRVDTQSCEATYVGTDKLRMTGPLFFEVCHKEEALICGAVENLEGQGIDRIGAVGTLSKGFKAGWVMECRCAISSPACVFLKRKGALDSMNENFSSPLMEVYVAGRCSGAPVVLTQTVELVLRRKSTHTSMLDSIPEADELERSSSRSTLADLASQVEELSFYQELDCKRVGFLSGYGQDSYMEGDEGETTWFNAGVRVGVGIGLGMCVGIGIGVGLMMRAYQSATRNLRRRFF